MQGMTEAEATALLDDVEAYCDEQSNDTVTYTVDGLQRFNRGDDNDWFVMCRAVYADTPDRFYTVGFYQDPPEWEWLAKCAASQRSQYESALARHRR